MERSLFCEWQRQGAPSRVRWWAQFKRGREREGGKKLGGGGKKGGKGKDEEGGGSSSSPSSVGPQWGPDGQRSKTGGLATLSRPPLHGQSRRQCERGSVVEQSPSQGRGRANPDLGPKPDPRGDRIRVSNYCRQNGATPGLGRRSSNTLHVRDAGKKRNLRECVVVASDCVEDWCAVNIALERIQAAIQTLRNVRSGPSITDGRGLSKV